MCFCQSTHRIEFLTYLNIHMCANVLAHMSAPVCMHACARHLHDHVCVGQRTTFQSVFSKLFFLSFLSQGSPGSTFHIAEPAPYPVLASLFFKKPMKVICSQAMARSTSTGCVRVLPSPRVTLRNQQFFIQAFLLPSSTALLSGVHKEHGLWSPEAFLWKPDLLFQLF